MGGCGRGSSDALFHSGYSGERHRPVPPSSIPPSTPRTQICRLAAGQVPCGIYDDAAKIKELKQHSTTITKATAQINSLSPALDAQALNQSVREFSNRGLRLTPWGPCTASPSMSIPMPILMPIACVYLTCS